MLVIESAHQITFCDENDLPTLACVDKCRKVWWESCLENKPKDACPLCASRLVSAHKDVHFNVLANANRGLRFSDFKKIKQMNRRDKVAIKELMERKVRISNLSLVKPAFEAKAKAEWCS